MGRMPNNFVIKKIKESDWAVVLREKNKIVQAGFPTKVSEAIACGTPVIANKFSNIVEYLNDDNSILINDITEFARVINVLEREKRQNIDRTIFDYRQFIDMFKRLLEET